jgi:hypothetical protein
MKFSGRAELSTPEKSASCEIIIEKPYPALS